MVQKKSVHRFNYMGIIADCDADRFDDLVKQVRMYTLDQRKKVRESVVMSLAKAVALGVTMTEQQKDDAAADIAIFFAIEFVEGRQKPATFTPYENHPMSAYPSQNNPEDN